MVYVVIQFSLLGYLIYNTPWTNYTLGSIIFFLLSLGLGLWAIQSMGLRNLSVFPDPKHNTKIRLSGPYKVVRHPMYTAVILFAVGMLLMHPVWQMYLGVIVLVADLVLKLRYEEKRLMQKFDVYEEYKNNSWCLIPYIY